MFLFFFVSSLVASYSIKPHCCAMGPPDSWRLLVRVFLVLNKILLAADELPESPFESPCLFYVFFY